MKSIAKALMAASDTVDRILRGTAIFFLCLMVGAIVLQVLARYGFSAPPAWTEEAARYCMVWVGLLGASVSYKIGFDPVLVKLPRKLSPALRVITAFFRGASVFIFLSPILWYSFFGPGQNVSRSFLMRNLNTMAESIDMPLIFIAITVPIFIGAIFLHGLAHMASAFQADKH
ncbi:TRAP transporter small permease [Roseibium suaedae]|uniref:TRAP transporter small permease protein n=1 Tax=Roseibium suaedae TaxID=735517 RepID=A0A1M7LE82_9HYPH|nr:TRAP transporter small permease [Roseibium suaedae]SHM76425.1 TRAP-type C4-dicarboxylate transport system, small permease component [Roseibium suaedae]